MRTQHWLSAFAPFFERKVSPLHRFSQQSVWRSQPMCLRSSAAGEVCRRRLSRHRQERFERVDNKSTCRLSGVPWVVWLEKLLRLCPVSLAQLSLGSWGRSERPRLGLQEICWSWPLLREPCFSWLLGTGLRSRDDSHSAARPTAIPAATVAVFSSSWAVACSSSPFLWRRLRPPCEQCRLVGRSSLGMPYLSQRRD